MYQDNQFNSIDEITPELTLATEMLKWDICMVYSIK